MVGVTSLAFENGLCQDHCPPALCSQAGLLRTPLLPPAPGLQGRALDAAFQQLGRGPGRVRCPPQSLSLTPHLTFGRRSPPWVSATGRNPKLGREPSGPPLDPSASVLLSEARAAPPRWWAEAPAVTGRHPGLAWGHISAPWQSWMPPVQLGVSGGGTPFPLSESSQRNASAEATARVGGSRKPGRRSAGPHCAVHKGHCPVPASLYLQSSVSSWPRDGTQPPLRHTGH